MTGTRPARPVRVCGVILVLVLALALAAFIVPPAVAADIDQRVTIQIKPVVFDIKNPEKTTFGKLAWRGGVELVSTPYENFGGLSGLVMSENGDKLTAVSDMGYWVSADMIYDQGTLRNMANITVHPLRDNGGVPYQEKYYSDAEALTRTPDGDYLVSFEQKHRLQQYDLARQGFMASGRLIELPSEIRNLRHNNGLEGITVLSGTQGEQILGFAEDRLDAARQIQGWLITAAGQAEPLFLEKIAAYNITDLASLPNGDVLTLERRFTLLGGPGVLIRRLKRGDIKPGAVLTGEKIFEADFSKTIDNMEGLAIHQSPDGETRLTLISDNNLSPIQRTLVLQFALIE